MTNNILQIPHTLKIGSTLLLTSDKKYRFNPFLPNVPFWDPFDIPLTYLLMKTSKSLEKMS